MSHSTKWPMTSLHSATVRETRTAAEGRRHCAAADSWHLIQPADRDNDAVTGWLTNHIGLDWIVQRFTLRPCQHSIGYMGDGFYRSKDPTNSIKVLKKDLQKKKKTTKTTKYTSGQTIIETQNDIHKISTTSPLVYTNMGWLGDSSHRGQGR